MGNGLRIVHPTNRHQAWGAVKLPNSFGRIFLEQPLSLSLFLSFDPEFALKPLVKIMLTLAAGFATTFLLLNATGIVTVAKIETWLLMAKSADPLWVAPVIALLLFIDLVISVPTLATVTLSGYFLGPVLGAVAGITGLLMAGLGGYAVSRRYGDVLLKWVVKDESKRAEAISTFQEHGAVVILLSRASPILPEVSACMAGMTRMPVGKFLVLWLAGSVPYAVIAAYAGSVSSLDNPQPAIFAAIGLMSFLWLSWLVVRGYGKRRLG